MSRDEIAEFRNRQLQALVAHAYENVPYYRGLFDKNGLRPEDIRTAADLAAIPITTKQDLFGRPEGDLIASGRDPRRLVIRITSGSTGEPTIIRRTVPEEALLRAFRFRAMRGFGLRLPDRRVGIVLVRSEDHRAPWIGLRIYRAVTQFRTVRIHCLLEPADIVRALREIRPHIITGFSSSLARVARCMGDEARGLITPRFIAAGGEVLTPRMREQIGDGFNARVFETYGSHELGLIGWECKETAELHTCDDGTIVEVLKDGRPAGPGEEGELVGTNLHAFAMPFIRYRLGDVVRNGSPRCRCGQPFATIREVQGRIVEYFELPDGRILHPWEIVLVFFRTAPWIRQYQLVQERQGRIILRAVAGVIPSPRDLAFLTEAVGTILGPEVEFTVELVPEIRPEPSGKVRVFQSLATAGGPSAFRA